MKGGAQTVKLFEREPSATEQVDARHLSENIAAFQKKRHVLLQSLSSSVRYSTNEMQTSEYPCMTISIGVTQYKKGDAPCDIIARADKALYEAKGKGKNCVVGRKS
jgi:PleD family two-component response regulator